MEYQFDGVFQENISNDIARTLLKPNEYDPKCRYQLVTMEDGQYVIKIDDRITPEVEEKNIKLDPTTDKRRITEYRVEDTDDECLPLEDMFSVPFVMNFGEKTQPMERTRDWDFYKIFPWIIAGLFLVWFILAFLILIVL